jgi:hypothetical protein
MADEKPLPTGDLPSEGIAKGPPALSAPLPTPGAITAEPLPVAPIPLETPKTRPASSTAPKKEPAEPKDTFRELLETVVFVVVLVLMLKTFLAEAFVIPTGSMAVTLLGYHHKESCKQCGCPNLVNASAEGDPQGGAPQAVAAFECENCGFINVRPAPRQGGQP